jgi:hypothetical protein
MVVLTDPTEREKKAIFASPKLCTIKVHHKNITKKHRQAWIKNLRLKSSGVESGNARVYGDHFVTGK